MGVKFFEKFLCCMWQCIGISAVEFLCVSTRWGGISADSVEVIAAAGTASQISASARFADVNFEIARAIANVPTRPIWNEGDFFGDLFSGK